MTKISRVIRRLPKSEDWRKFQSESFEGYTKSELEKALSAERSYTEEDMARGVVRSVIRESSEMFLSGGSSLEIYRKIKMMMESFEKRYADRKRRIKLLKKLIRGV